MTAETLWKDKWLQVFKYDGYYTGVKCTNDGVMVLGYQGEKVLVRVEKRPCHGPGLLRQAVTGALDMNLPATQTAAKELLEETGYNVHHLRLQPIGWVYASNFSETKIDMFVVDLEGLEQGEIIGDGSSGEDGAGAEWMYWKDAMKLNDVLIGRAIGYLLMEGKIG